MRQWPWLLLLGTQGAGSKHGPGCGPLTELGDGDAWVRARCGSGIADTLRYDGIDSILAEDGTFRYVGKSSVADEMTLATNHWSFRDVAGVISVEILKPVEGDSDDTVLLPDGAIEVPVVARVAVAAAKAQNCSFRVSLNDIVNRQASVIAREGHIHLGTDVGDVKWISANSLYLRLTTVLIDLVNENESCCEFVVRCSCFLSDAHDEVVGEASVVYSALVEKRAAQQRAERKAALAAEHARYRDATAAIGRSQPESDGSRERDPRASTSVINRLQVFLDLSLQGVWRTEQTRDSGHVDDSAWTWIDGSGRHWRVDDFEHSAWTSALRVVFYGSSHLRELHNEIVRWHLGVPGDYLLPEVVTKVASKSCFGAGCGRCSHRAGFAGASLPYLDGVDLKSCGPPGYRIVEELSSTFAIGFKTYIHTPLAEALFLERLSQDGLHHPDVLVVDCGIWGPRGRTGFNESDGANVYDYALPSSTEEVNYFVSWVHSHFADSLVVWIYGFCELRNDNLDTSTWGYEIQRSILDSVKRSRMLGRSLNSDLLVNKSRIAGFAEHENLRGVVPGHPAVRPLDMRCGHGGHGPALRVLAKIIKVAIDQYERALALRARDIQVRRGVSHI
jgi:hypothetical protein